jgi:hypothetical protein
MLGPAGRQNGRESHTGGDCSGVDGMGGGGLRAQGQLALRLLAGYRRTRLRSAGVCARHGWVASLRLEVWAGLQHKAVADSTTAGKQTQKPLTSAGHAGTGKDKDRAKVGRTIARTVGCEGGWVGSQSVSHRRRGLLLQDACWCWCWWHGWVLQYCCYCRVTYQPLDHRWPREMRHND